MATYLAQSSALEYATWYLARERAKSGVRGSALMEPIATMQADHRGKWRPWFAQAQWSRVELSLDDFRRLIYPAIAWSERQGLVVDDGPDYRLLDRVSRRAIETNYLARSDDTAQRHQGYFDQFRAGSLRLAGDSRIAVCSAESETTRNPRGSWYLLDGAGRCLPYMMLVEQGVLDYSPVEALVATKQGAIR